MKPLDNSFRILASLIFLMLFHFSYGQEGWVNQTPSYPLSGLLAVFAIDANDIWISGEEGRILHSTDGGVSWDSVASGVTESLYTVEFINPDTGYVGGDDDYSFSTVLRTTDGGETWEPQVLQAGAAIPIYDIDFISTGSDGAMTGYLTGGLGWTWKSEDVNTWATVRNNCENTFYSCFFVNKDTGWFVGTPSVAEPYTIMQTTDGGSTWQQQTNPTGTNLRGVSFGNENQGIAVGLAGAVIYTSDGGATWEAVQGLQYNRWESVYLTSTGKAWMVGAKGKIGYSEDWGHTWVLQESGASDAVELWEVYFINDEEGWIVGGGVGQPGVILHTTTGGKTGNVGWVKPSIIEVEKNFPNPFSHTTMLHFSLFRDASVTIEVFNALGKRMNSMVLPHLPAGPHQVEFDGSVLPEGIYFYRITNDNTGTFRKMMIVR